MFVCGETAFFLLSLTDMGFIEDHKDNICRIMSDPPRVVQP